MNEKQYRYYKGCKVPCDKDPRPKCHCRHCNKECKEMKDRIEISPSNTNTFNPTFNPSITINMPSTPAPSPIHGLKTFQYMTLAGENKRIYTNQDALKQYGSSDILKPETISYMNLFINGVFQPDVLYEVKEDYLHLTSSDLPLKGSPIILLFVVIEA